MQPIQPTVARDLVAVVIPFHKANPDANELRSLRRCCDILKSYPRILAVSNSLDTQDLQQTDNTLQIVRFPDIYFSSWKGYNLLCRSPEFYERFLNYKYVLIHQLDCYIFRDELLYWCEKDYDYVGAAWLRHEHLMESKKWYSKAPFLKIFLRQTAQGGFSLRRVMTFYNAAVCQAWLLKHIINLPEDVYWSTIGSRLYHPFKIAGINEAIKFSFDASPELAFRMNNDQLPFGCHGWYGKHTEFWKDKIER